MPTNLLTNYATAYIVWHFLLGIHMSFKDIEERLKKSTGWDWKNLEQLALDIGFAFQGQTGSHRKYWHQITKKTIIIPSNHDLRRTDCNIVSDLRDTWKLLHPKEEIMTKPPNEEIYISWRDKLREIRSENHLSLKEVGERMGYPENQAVNMVYEFEKRKRLMSVEDFNAWCKVFHLNPKEQTWMTEFETNEAIIIRRKNMLIIPGIQPSFKEATVENVAACVSDIPKDTNSRVSDLNILKELNILKIAELEEKVRLGKEAELEYERLGKIIEEGKAALPKIQQIYQWLEDGEKLLNF